VSLVIEHNVEQFAHGLFWEKQSFHQGYSLGLKFVWIPCQEIGFQKLNMKNVQRIGN
jgi:hypothetical protein